MISTLNFFDTRLDGILICKTIFALFFNAVGDIITIE